jgi:hypothetical protein
LSDTLDAGLIAEDLGLDPAQVLDALRTRQLTALCERGIAEDAGHFRLTFHYADRRLRLIIDAEGRILARKAEKLRQGSSVSR